MRVHFLDDLTVMGTVSDYKGILITPYQPGLSHGNGNPDFHW